MENATRVQLLGNSRVGEAANTLATRGRQIDAAAEGASGAGALASVSTVDNSGFFKGGRGKMTPAKQAALIRKMRERGDF